MMWNMLWMAAVAAASALAGFCMGRLSTQSQEAYEEGAGEQTLPRGMTAREGRMQQSKQAEAVQEVDRETVPRQGQRPYVGTPGWTARRMPGMTAREDRMQQAKQAEAVKEGTRQTWSDRAREAGWPDKAEAAWDTARETMPRQGQRPYGGTPGWTARRTIRGEERLRLLRRMGRAKNQQTPQGPVWPVGSPVSGWLTALREGERPTVTIQPLEEKLYAPAAGKIIKLFPMGNAFLLATEFGTQLLIQVCDVEDDLLGRYFRPRVVQNEIVGKGKLLLEFDAQGLLEEGTPVSVSVRVENRGYGHSVYLTAGERIKIGEEILQVIGPAQ